jgi:hypothetical protein
MKAELISSAETKLPVAMARSVRAVRNIMKTDGNLLTGECEGKTTQFVESRECGIERKTALGFLKDCRLNKRLS